MKLEIANVARFIEVNQLKPITALTFFEATGAPTEGGLFSTSIFGRAGSEDRRRRWAYIELNGRFLHPLCYKTICQLDRKFPEFVAGQRRVRLSKSGEIQDVPEDEDDGWTGLDALYDNWDKINWGEAVPGSQRAERVGMLKTTPRERAFVSRWHVVPAMFRDVDTSSGNRVKEIPPINSMYIQLMTSAPTRVSGLTFVDGTRKRRAQEALYDIHRASLDLVAGKYGIIQDRLLGKYTDWAVRGVISGPALAKANHPGDQEIPFGWLGVPLYLVINAFQPFIIKRLTEIFRLYAQGQERILVRAATPDKEPTYFEIPPDVKSQLEPELYRKWIARFMRSQANRTDPVVVRSGKGKDVTLPLYDSVLGRPTTLLDLFYIVATDVIADKHMMFTRYPVEDFRACHVAKVKILTGELTEQRQIGEQVYPTYPVISSNIRWIDSFRLNNAYTKAMGADYDGDTHRAIGIFTQEANARAAWLINQPTNYGDGQGNFGRLIANEGVLTLYALTK